MSFEAIVKACPVLKADEKYCIFSGYRGTKHDTYWQQIKDQIQIQDFTVFTAVKHSLPQLSTDVVSFLPSFTEVVGLIVPPTIVCPPAFFFCLRAILGWGEQLTTTSVNFR